MTRLFVAIMTFAVMAIPAVASADLLINPGFETGDTTGWDVSSSTNLWTTAVENTTVYSGNYAFGVNLANAGDWEAAIAKQNFAIKAGDPLSGSVYVKTAGLTGAEAYLEAIFKDSLNNEIGAGKLVSSHITTSIDWTNLTVSGSAPGGSASVDYRLVVFAPGTGSTAAGNVYWDNASATSAAPEPISTILFLTGGTVLAVRRIYINKR